MSLFETQADFEPEAAADFGDSSTFDPGEFLRVVKARWLFIAVVTLCAIGLGVTHYLLTEKLYRASATLRIEQRSIYSMGGERNPWVETWANVKYYPTQYRLLRSRGLSERVVEHLRLGTRASDPSSAEPLGGGLIAGGDSPTSEASISRLAGRLSSGLTVDPVRGTELVEITYVSSDPELAAQIANAYSEVFISWEIENRSENVNRASTFLASQIETLRREIDQKERQLAEAGRGSDFVQLDSEGSLGTLTAQRLSNLNTDYSTAVSARLELDARYRELGNLPDDVAAQRFAPELLNGLTGDQAALEKEYEVGLQTYKPEWPAMVDLRSRIEESRQQLARVRAEQADNARKAAFAEYQTALRRERSLLAELQRAKSTMFDQGSEVRDLSDLQTEISTLRDLQDELVTQLSQTGLSADATGAGDSNIHIIDRALVPTRPFRPSLRNDLALGTAMGVMMGIALVLLIHFLDRTVKSPEELERLLGLPLLGVIPDISESSSRLYGYTYGGRQGTKRGKRSRREDDRTDSDNPIELLPALRPRLAISEAYRSLRTALLLSTAETLKVVSITSAEAGEGKTATVVNLAVVMAQLGRKVLLVDSDLRKPRLHRVLGVSNRRGLVNFLTGSASPDEIFQRPPGADLTFCPSGPHPPNPSELLSSERMREFLEMAQTRFDFVLLDSPPVLPVTDAIVLGTWADGVVLCSRANKVLREDVKACRDRLRQSEVKMLGAVLNCHRPSAGGYGKRYHYYEAYAETTDEDLADSAA